VTPRQHIDSEKLMCIQSADVNTDKNFSELNFTILIGNFLSNARVKLPKMGNFSQN
jgi:hypothetical protein